MSIVKKLQETSKEKKELKLLSKKLSFNQFLELAQRDPNILRNTFQRTIDMIDKYGTEKIETASGDIITKYNFFQDPVNNGKNAIFGMDEQLEKITNFFRNGAKKFGSEKRVLLLHGPVGSAKSTISTQLKKGRELYSKEDDGALYTYSWVDPDGLEPLMKEGKITERPAPMQANPLLLLPLDQRKEFMKTLDYSSTKYSELELTDNATLNPFCKEFLNHYLEKYDYDFDKVLENHIVVKRVYLDEMRRVGIGTFQPKDEKNQDSTELTGDLNFSKLHHYGSDSDPRAFNFDGELCVANRGVIEFIEMLKLETAFLYELLTVSQEKVIKPKKFAQIELDTLIIGHTNEAEFKKLQNDEFMEALRDRTVKIDIPYITELDKEVEIYKKDYNQKNVSIHIAPNALKAASIFSVLTRLEADKSNKLTPLQKMDFYNHKTVSNLSPKDLKLVKDSAEREGLEGISPRYIQDKIANALVKNLDAKCVSGFSILAELKQGLKGNALINTNEKREKFEEAIELAEMKLQEMVQIDVQKASVTDDTAMIRGLFLKYVENVKSYTQSSQIKNDFTKKLENPDENFMRSIEEYINVPERTKDDFRKQIMNTIGAYAVDGKKFDFDSNSSLYQGLQAKLIEEGQKQINFTSYFSNVIDKETQGKIDVIKQRLIDKMGYCEHCAEDALQITANILAKRK